MSPPTATATTRRAAARRASAARRAAGRRRRRWLLLLGAAAVVLVVVIAAMPLFKVAVSEFGLPLHDQSVIREQAAAKNLDPALIAAVIYAETKFDPRTSSAGAVGLMQILPQTAKFLAHRSGATTFTTADLGTPAVNIAYGSYYLRYLLDQYHGSTVLALAAYNGGQANVESLDRRRARRRAPLRPLRHRLPRDPRLRGEGLQCAQPMLYPAPRACTASRSAQPARLMAESPITVTLVDGLVLARSAFHSSVNVAAHGRGRDDSDDRARDPRRGGLVATRHEARRRFGDRQRRSAVRDADALGLSGAGDRRVVRASRYAEGS